MEKLKFINEQLTALGINYEYGEWSTEITYPYFTGELTEEPTLAEDGCEESTLILNGFHRERQIALEEVKEIIKRHFHPNYGCRGKTANGRIVVLFDGSFYVPGEEAELKRIEIHLKIKEWKVY